MKQVRGHQRFGWAPRIVLLLWSSPLFAQSAAPGAAVGPASGASGAESPRVPWQLPPAILLITALLVVAMAVAAFVIRSHRSRSEAKVKSVER